MRKRLEEAASKLAMIDATRESCHNPAFGENTEHLIISNEIAEIERNILEDPGELERFLVRIR
ncbi:MAG: hypothetical protein FJW31_11075 [Acidobacteria bacterium]|nr:hypothetical protein [Acidobacteriota bacterium]